MKRAAITALLLTATLLASNHAQAKTLWILPNHHVRFDNGPELNSIQFRIDLKKMTREGRCRDVRVMPISGRVAYNAVAHVLMDLHRFGCIPRAFITGEEQYIPDK